jgi:hypothetical protein
MPPERVGKMTTSKKAMEMATDTGFIQISFQHHHNGVHS